MDTSDLADANPATGIVWAYRFRPDGTAEPIPNDKVGAALAEHGQGWIWLHLALADARCRAWIAQYAPVSELAREVLAGPDRHLRLDILGQEIVGVVPDLHQEFAQLGEDVVRLRFVMTERMLITARQRPAHSIENSRRAVESGKLFPTAISFLDAVIDEFADTVGRMAERFGDELDHAEDHVMDEEPQTNASGSAACAFGRCACIASSRSFAGCSIGLSRASPRTMRPLPPPSAHWHKSSMLSTAKSALCTNARGYCSTSSTRR